MATLQKSLSFEDLPLADVIYLRRKQLKISQAKLAKAAGCSRNYISQIERGRTQQLTIMTLNRIAGALCLELTIEAKVPEKKTGE